MLIKCFILLTSLLLANDNCASNLSQIATAKDEEKRFLRVTQEISGIFTALTKKVQNSKKKNPFINAGVDLDSIGLVHNKLEKAFPHYRSIYDRLNRREPLSLEAFEVLAGKSVIEAKKILGDTTGIADFAALEAMRSLSRLSPLVQRKRPEPTEHLEDKPKEDSEKKQKKGQTEPTPPEWDNPPEKYMPFNKKLEQGGGGTRTMQLRTDVVTKSVLLPYGYLDGFNSNEGYAIPAIRPATIPSGEVLGSQWIRKAGSPTFTLNIPEGYVPVTGEYADFHIVERVPGQFDFVSKNGKTDEFEIPLKKAATVFEKGDSLTGYTDKSGILFSDWPQDYQLLVKDLKKRETDPEKIVEAIKGLIRSKKYYSKSEKVSEGDLNRFSHLYDEMRKKYDQIPALAHTEAYNCDGAAVQMAVLLRDEFNVPARVVIGRTFGGKKAIDGKMNHLMFTEDPKHAWVEVWLPGKGWVSFDPTPPHPTRGESGQQDFEAPDHEKKAENSSKEKQEGNEKNEAKKSEGELKEKSSERKDKEAANELESLEESLLLKHLRKKNGGAFENSALQDLIEQYFMERILTEGGSMDKLSELYKVREGRGPADDNIVKTTLDNLRSKLRDHHGMGMNANLAKIHQSLKEGNVEEAYSLNRALIEDIGTIEVSRPLTSHEQGLRQELQKLETDLFKKYRRKDSVDGKLVADLLDRLPGKVSKEILLERYGADAREVGSRSGAVMAEHIRNGKLQHYLKMAEVAPLVNMWLKPVSEKRYSKYKTPYKARVRTEDQTVVTSRSLDDFDRWIIELQPGEPIYAPMLRGEQFAIGSVEEEFERTPQLRDFSKLSYILYDKSGSMQSRVDIQDALLSSFVSKAGSERDRLGKPNHQVFSAAFGDKVRTDTLRAMTTTKESKDEILRLENTRTVADEGTDIEQAVLWFFEEVKKAHSNRKSDRSLRKLKVVNLVLFTDGGSPVNYQRLKAARESLPKDIQVNFHFVALGGDNEALEKLANESSLGLSHSSVTTLTESRISKIQSEAAKPKIDEKASFKSNVKDLGAVDAETLGLSQGVSRTAVDFRRNPLQAKVAGLFSELAENVELDLDAVSWNGVHNLSKTIEQATDLDGVPPELKLKISNYILEAFRAETGRDLGNLLVKEREQFDKLKAWGMK